MWLKEKRGVLEHLCRWMQAALSSHGADPQAVSAYMQAGTWAVQQPYGHRDHLQELYLSEQNLSCIWEANQNLGHA